MENMWIDTLANVTQPSSAREELGKDPNNGCVEDWGPVHRYQFWFENGGFFSGLAYLSHVSIENGHRKRIFSKTLDILENSVSCTRMDGSKRKYLRVQIPVMRMLRSKMIQIWM